MLVPGLDQIQIVQEELDRLRLRIVRGEGWGADSEARIGELVRERFGSAMVWECEWVERIDPGPSGKVRFCISKVANPYTTLPGS